MNWFQTYSGVKFDLNNPTFDMIRFRDIAHSLSRICRYNGHCEHFYSVAQHSVYVSMLVPDKYKLEALLHDAAEAYTSDIPTPIKATIPSFEAFERKIALLLSVKFGIPATMSAVVKEADEATLAAEKDWLTIDYGYDWGITKTKNPVLLGALSHGKSAWESEPAKFNFLDEFNLLF